ncbi:M50 family metallopeptidase [Argonema galeatum]|uniref:M50 family metallopeptidase n=1 Tax=Argonema galeatum TaxID=2942762 RepID=UPI0020112AB2|nr:M50 family metallopeptidase [Argonema galeatum]MCL1464371.1 M50 family metallopeptidase [Argonema galeatum A003/A1]
MQLGKKTDAKKWRDSICPDITVNWQLGQLRKANKVILQSKTDNRRYEFEATEGHALRHFTGQFTMGQVQDSCSFLCHQTIEDDFVVKFQQKLTDLGILETATKEQQLEPTPEIPNFSIPPLKPTVQWIRHPDGYWLLRNPEDIAFLQVNDIDKPVISQLGKLPLPEIIEKYDISREQLEYLLQMLAATGMLEGTKPAKPPRKFTLLQLLFFKFPLFNPDSWLTQHLNKVRFIFNPIFSALLLAFLSSSIAIGISRQAEIIQASRDLWSKGFTNLILPFALLIMLVVSLHELGHAFTLKHYGGIVPEIGLMFICLLPGAYTNTTDAYSLVKRRQRALVMVAGVLCQLVIWAIALWIWMLSNSVTWLHQTSYLLMVAAQLTLALNLNPLNRFDGYYLAVAMTGINNLRQKSFKFYAQMLKGEPSLERPNDQLILAAYAPCCLIYIVWVFGYLLFWLGNLLLANLR